MAGIHIPGKNVKILTIIVINKTETHNLRMHEKQYAA